MSKFWEPDEAARTRDWNARIFGTKETPVAESVTNPATFAGPPDDQAYKARAAAAIPPDAPRSLSTWQHYKGGLYTVLGTGIDEDTGRPRVAYISQKLGVLMFRTLDNWTETVGEGATAGPRFREVK